MKAKEKEQREFLLKLYHDYYALVWHKAQQITGATDQLPDLVNDTFVKLIDKAELLGSLQAGQRTTYIVYTARSVALNYARRRSLHDRHIYYSDDLGQAPDQANTEELVLKREALTDLQRAILRLPERERDLLHFKYLLELSDKAIGEILGISTASVRQYLTRARRAAKELMREGGERDG